jgi:phage shock protein C
MSEIRRLQRSTLDAMAGGVCGGLAEYLGSDATLVRLATVVLTLCFPPLVFAYLLAWIIVPAAPEGHAAAASAAAPAATGAPPGEEGRSRSPQLVAGFVLVALGLFLLAERLGLFDLWFFRWITWGNLWPLALVALGVYLVFRGLSSPEESPAGGPPAAPPPGVPPPAGDGPPAD